jgi:hypothetical protein
LTKQRTAASKIALRVSALFSACQPSPARAPFWTADFLFAGDTFVFFDTLELGEIVVLFIIVFAGLTDKIGAED